MFVLQADHAKRGVGSEPYTLAVGENIDTLRAFGAQWAEEQWYTANPVTWAKDRGSLSVPLLNGDTLTLRAWRIHVVE